MRDQPAFCVHHVGVSTISDLDLRHHVPDQLEIDLGHAHAGIAAGPRQRQRHVRFGLAPEVDRAVIDLVRHGVGEFWVLGKVGLARHYVHRQTRDAQLLASGRVELRKLGDRRDLTQQSQPIEAALVDGSGRPRQLSGPPDLALDLLDERADLRRRRLRLLALDADQRGLVLLIGEPDFRQAVGEQGHADHGQEQRDVFAKQPAAALGRFRYQRRDRDDLARALVHPMTSSAKARSFGPSPRAPAALRSIINCRVRVVKGGAAAARPGSSAA